jgi:hypothetical protein
MQLIVKTGENLLQMDSLIPTAVHDRFLLSAHLNDVLLFQNPFSAKLAQFGFYLYFVLVVDLMHEFELRVWKAVFIHLLRILDSETGIPAFGCDGVRKTRSNRSELKQVTVHDYKDVLQVGLEFFN